MERNKKCSFVFSLSHSKFSTKFLEVCLLLNAFDPLVSLNRGRGRHCQRPTLAGDEHTEWVCEVSVLRVDGLNIDVDKVDDFHKFVAPAALDGDQHYVWQQDERTALWPRRLLCYKNDNALLDKDSSLNNKLELHNKKRNNNNKHKTHTHTHKKI